MKNYSEMIVIISKKNLELKPITILEWQLYHKLYGNPNVMKFFDSGKTYTEEETKQFVEKSVNRWKNGDILSPFTIWKDKKEFIGFVNLRHAPFCKQPGHVEIGYMVVEEYQRGGYGTDAAEAIMDYLQLLFKYGYKMGNANLTTVVATVHPNNKPSQVILEKRLGMHTFGEAYRQEYPRVFFIKTLAAPSNKSSYIPEDIFINVSPNTSLRAKL